MLFAIHWHDRLRLTVIQLEGGHVIDESNRLSHFKLRLADHKLEFYYPTIVCNVSAYALECDRVPLEHPPLFIISDTRGTMLISKHVRSWIRL